MQTLATKKTKTLTVELRGYPLCVLDHMLKEHYSEEEKDAIAIALAEWGLHNRVSFKE